MTTPIDISEESGVRYLHFGSEWVQGAMRIRKPDALELDYTREMMVPLLLHGAEFIANDTARWDLIAVDGFDRNARAGALASQVFYEACRARLSEQGLLVANLFGQLRGYKTQLQRLGKAFDGRVLALAPVASGNVVAFAAAGEPVESSLIELRQQAAALKAATGLDLAPTLKQLEKAGLAPAGNIRF